VSVSILINKLTLCHKGDAMGTVTATVPDVCMTPAPPSPVPVPYPNIALATDLAGGTTTVFVDGGNMAANSASVFAKSSGDEPGTLGGIASGVNMADASWLSYSMDVFLEGLNACRLTDKMLLNHGNTVSMGGFLTDELKRWLDAAKTGTVDCDWLLERINEILNGNKAKGTAPTPDTRGVKERYYQQIYGSIKPSDPGWDTHNDQFEDMQSQLRDHLDAYDKYCKGGTPVPSDAWFWATRKKPTAKDYRGPPVPATTPDPKPVPPVVWWALAAAILVAIAYYFLPKGSPNYPTPFPMGPPIVT
jgi:hypothetical protein